MPLALLERIPLPSFRVYVSVSVALFSVSVYYASITTDWTKEIKTNEVILANSSNHVSNASADGAVPLLDQLYVLGNFMTQEPLSLWILMNSAYCLLIVIGRVMQAIVFGELRVSERQHLKDKFWNFVFHKFIFIFGVINAQLMEEVMLWCSWFGFIGAMQLLCLLCKDRFEYLSFSPATSKWNHCKLLIVLSSILIISYTICGLCSIAGFVVGGFNIFAFMAAECLLLFLRTLHVITKYALYLYDMKSGPSQRVNAPPLSDEPTLSDRQMWEKRNTAYYTDLHFELIGLVIDLIHHLHMLLWSNIFLSMASLVICMQLRYLFHEIQRRLKRHKNYLTVLNYMEKNYPMISGDLLNDSSTCAICWETMDSARKLPCSHFFHNSCLQSWLEQDTSCPTCRMTLNMIVPGAEPRENPETATGTERPVQGTPRNHFFHFDGSRYISWLPSFSVEVTHTRLLPNQLPPPPPSQLDAIARTVQQLFPNILRSAIIEDLQRTRSIELTIENILDGRLSTSNIFHDETDDAFNADQSDAPANHDAGVSGESVTDEAGTTAEASMSSSDVVDRVEDIQTDETNVGGGFSKSPKERERILSKRKEQVLLNARKKYLDKFERKND